MAQVVNKRKLPKLMACLTKTSLETMRNKALYSLNTLDAKGIRRRKLALHECLILELQEAGFNESSDYLQDLIYDNLQLVEQDEIGIVFDLREKHDFLKHISEGLQRAESQRDKGNTKKECLELLTLAMHYAEKGKGILWLAEKFFLASIAVGSQYMIDGGRLKGCCKYHYAKFLLDKFPGADTEEPFQILTEVRDSAIGKDWSLFEAEDGDAEVPSDTLFAATAIQQYRVLLDKARSIQKDDPGKAERLARLAERRARDADDTVKTAEAIIEIGTCQLMMNNLNNALKTFERALAIHTQSNNIEGLCETKMHLAAVMQRLEDHEAAANLLTEMGTLAMKYNVRKHLGRALHLLGELHLRRDNPKLGTQYLSEAFSCFMGYGYIPGNENINSQTCDSTSNEKMVKKENDVFVEEAEQSRLMMAISSGQELMASFFDIINRAKFCNIAQIKLIEWKLSRSGWWVNKQEHEFIPCMCQIHNRTPLDALWLQLDYLAANSSILKNFSEGDAMLQRYNTVHELRKVRSMSRKLSS